MKFLLIGLAGYVALVFYRNQQINAASAACLAAQGNVIGTAANPACPAAETLTQQWAWLPLPNIPL